MPVHLLERVRQELLPSLSGSGLALTYHTGGRWSYETVDLERDDLRIRITKGSGAFEVLFGSSADPQGWFNSGELFAYLQYGHADIAASDVNTAFRELRDFLQTHVDRATEVFSRGQYSQSKRELMKLRIEETERRFPSSRSKKKDDPSK